MSTWVIPFPSKSAPGFHTGVEFSGDVRIETLGLVVLVVRVYKAV